MNALATVNESQLAAFGSAASALAGGGKPFLSCKKGDWYFGQEDKEIPAGARVAINMMEAEWGWLHWKDKEVVGRKMLTVASGNPIADRGELGDDDKDLWPRDDQNNPQDPWQKTIEIPGRFIDGDKEEFVVAGSSKGFEGACKALFKAFGEHARANPGKVPVVELGVSKYNHKKYGITKVPVLDLVDWADPAALEAGAEPETKAKKKATF